MTIANVIAAIKKHGVTIGTIESFTGGLVSYTFLANPGASTWFFQGFVLYQTLAKANWLGLSEKTLLKIDPVSEAMVKKLLKQASKKYPNVLWVVTTGNAGPTTQGNQPIGQAYFGVGNHKHQLIKSKLFLGHRTQIQEAGVDYAIALLKEYLSTYY
jgi:PncC family amidohydrolase